MDSNHIPSCTSAGNVLQLCKVLQNSNKPFRSCAYKVHDLTFRQSISWIISPCKFKTSTVFLHADLQVVYYNCVKFHKNSISSLVGVALTRYIPPPFRESISWIISPFKCWAATIFLHAYLQVVYYKCAKFHKNPITRLGGVALTRYMDELTDVRRDGWTDGWTDRVIPLYPQTLFAVGIIRLCPVEVCAKTKSVFVKLKFVFKQN